ncbi:MAG TPA: GGDEF domain-containing protein [Micropepsaceae bacterium]|nr:GGDEF domain-containing protein [Micropepsaceae bacterium]
MKVGKADRSSRTGKIAAAAKPGSAAVPMSAAAMTSAAVASVLGIPEEELTPQVRDAIMTLMREVDRLRQEIEQTRTHLDEMARTADQDMLLPILNRRAFVREISRFIAFAERYGVTSSLLYFDLDNFKAVNDAYGHSAGDFVLHHFTDLLSAQIRDSDVLARIGGDEFAIILAHVTLDLATKKGESLSQSLRDQPPVWNGKKIELSFSCGVYELHAGTNADTAIAHADRAMYAQKRSAAKAKL